MFARCYSMIHGWLYSCAWLEEWKSPVKRRCSREVSGGGESRGLRARDVCAFTAKRQCAVAFDSEDNTVKLV